jgi:anti-sigma factor RsiW
MSRHKLGKTCSEFEAHLEDFVSNDLSSPQQERIAAHLRECSACSETVALAKASRRLMQDMSEPVADPGPFFTRRVMASVRAEEDRAAAGSGFWSPLEVFSLRAAWTAAAALVLLLSYGAVSGIPVRPPLAEVRSADSVGLFPDPGSQSINPDDVLTYVGEANHGK